MKLKSTGAGFLALSNRFDAFADAAPRKMAESATEIANLLIAAEYATESDPRRKRWPKKKIPNGQPQGVASGDTRDSAKAVAGPNGQILLSVDTDHATFLQNGTVHMKPRAILPFDKLTTIWKDAIDEAAHQGLHDAWESVGGDPGGRT